MLRFALQLLAPALVGHAPAAPPGRASRLRVAVCTPQLHFVPVEQY
jgi:hypothetical protein